MPCHCLRTGEDTPRVQGDFGTEDSGQSDLAVLADPLATPALEAFALADQDAEKIRFCLCFVFVICPL